MILTLAAMMLAFPAGVSATVLPKTISEDMTLTASASPYTGTSTIESGTTVDIEAGTELRLSDAFTVKGTLKAAGTAEKPVLFTSAADSGAGQWKGILFNSVSGSSVLEHVVVRYAGNLSTAAITIHGVSPAIKNSNIHHSSNWGINVLGGGAPNISGNWIHDNGRSGILYEAGSGSTGQIQIHHNIIEDNNYSGVWIGISGSSVAGTTLGENTVKDNGDYGIYYAGGDIPPDIDENTLSGNVTANLVLRGTLSQSATWSDHGYPVRIEGGGLTVESGATLSLAPGVIFKSNSQELAVNGTLKAEGTGEKPIVLTSTKDSGAGQWKGIAFKSGSGASVLDHTEIRYTGSASSTSAITISGVSPAIKNSTIRNNSYWGISASGGGAPEISGNAILSNGRSGILYEAGSGKTGKINIHGNVIEGNSNSGVWVGITNSSVTGTTLAENTIKGNGDYGIYYAGGNLPPDIDDNTLSLNVAANLVLRGTVAQSASWTDRGYPIRIDGGALTVAGSTTLTLGPGLTLKSKSEEIAVSGTLKAEGTEEDPITFTSLTDTGAGQWKGIAFKSGSGASVLDYAEVRYTGSASNTDAITITGVSPTIKNSSINNNSYRGIRVAGGSPSITHSYVGNNNSTGIYVSSGTPTIKWVRFSDNNGYGLFYEGTGTLDASYNDWGCSSGPSPAGCGASVNSKVKWKPAITFPAEDGDCIGLDNDCGRGADPVVLSTGALAYTHRDLLLANNSKQPLEFTRSYSSANPSDTSLGTGWSQTGLATASEVESGDVLIVRQDGRQDFFQKTESGYAAPPSVTDSLVKTEGTFQLTTLENMVYRFDESGRIASITDDHGLKTTYGYDANGRLATITDPSAQTLTFSYNASNHITLVEDSTGREVKYTYSAAGDLATVTDPLGGVTEYTYDASHRLKTIKDPRGNVILKNTFDPLGRVIEQRDGLENLWKLEYKEGETVVTEPEGGKLAYGFDSQKRVVSEKDQLGRVTTTSYDEAGNVDEIVKPGGAKWQFGHDGEGNLTSVVDPEEGERGYEYDSLNRLTSFTDEREETWTYEWDEGNDLVRVTDPAEGETTFTHNASGQPLTVTDPNEHTTTFTYDTRGNRLSAKDALEDTTAYAYNSRNQLTSRTSPGLKPELYGRNALGDLLSVTTPGGHKTAYAYNANGMLTQITDPAEGIWEIERNAMERPTAYIDPLEQKSGISYDGNLRPVSVSDRRGKETTYAYDLANQLTEIVRPEGGDWAFDYDVRGNRIEVIEPRENATTYEFDLLDRMTEAAEPLEATTSYGYDPVGNLTSFTDPNENTTGLIYDELGRLTEIDQPLEKTTTFTYDGVGNRLTRTTAAGTIALDYDAANRLEEISHGESTLRAFDYDPAGRLVGATDAQADEIEIAYDDGRVISIDDDRGQTVSRDYDTRGNLVKQVDGRGTLEYEFDKLSQMIELTDPQGKVLDFDYDPEGNLTKVELPIGVVTTSEFDDAGRLAEATSTKGETTLESLEYEYDPAGNRIGQVDRLSQQTSYEYDALNRLIGFDPPGEGATAYDYDPAGNRIEAGATTYAFNDLNQLTSASDGTTYDYDDAGRLIEVAKGETSTTYDWNPLDELKGVHSGPQEIDYAYDAFGRQVLRDDGSTIRPTHYGDLSDLPILDTDAEGEPTMSYVQGPAGLIEQRSGGATSFPLRDAHGDITTLADAEGAVASRQTYDPWGEQLSGPSLEMGWLGAQQRQTDPATGMVQMGIRPYASALGRFVTEDPVVNRVGLGVTANRYPYGSSNPVNRNDLDGRETCVPTPLGTACAPVTVHPPVPTPSDPVPELPITVDGIPTPADTVNSALPSPATPSGGDMADSLRDGGEFVADRALAFFKKHGGALLTGCVTGGAGGFFALNAMTGGAPVFIPGLGWLTEGGSALAGCAVGATGMATTGINPIRRN